MKSGQSVVTACLAAVTVAGGVSGSLAQAPPTTVVTHGYQLGGTVPDWPYALADAIAHRAADQGGEAGQVLVYEGTSGDLLPCQESWCSASGQAHTVIVFDWADDSNEDGAGFSEAAAEALFAGLIAWSQAEEPLVDLTRLHLIGHSRGAVVNSEVAERLIAAGLGAPDQVTSLDPHDAGGAFVAAGQLPEGGLDDYDVNQEHPEYDCHSQSTTPGVCSWLGIGHHDNYWQDDSGCLFLLPDGMGLYGAANRCPPGPNQQQMVLFEFDLPEGLVNGDFERTRAAGAQSGWSFHGGELQGVSGFDTDTHWILTGGESARHNRFYLPARTRSIQLCRKIEIASSSDSLSLRLISPGFPDREMLDPAQQSLGTSTDWECMKAPVLQSETGTAVQVLVSVTNVGSPTVLIDDIQLVLDIFSDGFEAGDTSLWSTTVP